MIEFRYLIVRGMLKAMSNISEAAFFKIVHVFSLSNISLKNSVLELFCRVPSMPPLLAYFCKSTMIISVCLKAFIYYFDTIFQFLKNVVKTIVSIPPEKVRQP